MLNEIREFIQSWVEGTGDPYYIDPSRPLLLAKYLGAIAILSLVIAAIIYFRNRQRVISSLGLVAIALLAGLGSLYLSRDKFAPPLIFSEQLMLESLWRTYKSEYLEAATGRTIDKQRNNVTTSEGQAYTMLRAVWMGDKQAFDQSWSWTKENLQRPDKLFAWLYGLRADGTYGILTESNGQNTASDADVDIALALVFAYSRWQELDYLKEAYAIIPQIWEQEVMTINGTPYLLANNFDKRSTADTALLNPSYFAPYAYRIFATIDRTHPWLRLVDSSYSALERSIRLPLDRSQSARLPPDWVAVDKQTGEIRASTLPELTTNYGFDAMRVPWRIALDAAWYNEPRARSVLGQMSFLGREWGEKKKLASTYTHDGQTILGRESPAMYGAALSYFSIADPEQARAVYLNKLVSLYQPDFASWRVPLSYYDDNLAWFGLALYNQSLPNLHALNFQ